jgi:hypothetical protein
MPHFVMKSVVFFGEVRHTVALVVCLLPTHGLQV